MLRSREPAPVFFSIFLSAFFFIVLSLLFGLVFFPLVSTPPPVGGGDRDEFAPAPADLNVVMVVDAE